MTHVSYPDRSGLLPGDVVRVPAENVSVILLSHEGPGPEGFHGTSSELWRVMAPDGVLGHLQVNPESFGSVQVLNREVILEL